MLIRPCTLDDVEETADLLAQAFEDEPAYCYLMQDPRRRRAGLQRFFAGNLSLHIDHKCTHVLLDAGRLIATVTLRPPSGIAISPLTMIRHGLLPFALEHGASAVRRMLWLKDTYDAFERDAAKHQPHWYVHMMAVRPDVQGRGHGSTLLRHVMEQARTCDASRATVLTTHRAQNVTYYRRAGFEVTAEQALTPPRGTTYTVWSMTRAPNA